MMQHIGMQLFGKLLWVASYKDIESYGILKLNDNAKEFLVKPTSFMIREDHDYSNIEEQETD